MRVEFRRSGGIAGIDMTANVDARELSAEQAQLVAELMSPGTAPAPPPGGAGAPDRFSYELTVTDGERTRTYDWQEAEVPEAVRPLLASLGARARPAPPG
jgi:hypothetical protein